MVLYESPMGPLGIAVDSMDRLVRISFDPSRVVEASDGDHEPVIVQLDEYFAGQRRRFELDIALQGSEFQMQVWQEVARVPFGQTASYLEIATRIGNPGAVRAVGGANNRNPIPLVIPCHRIIGADMSLTGFGGGLENKQWLLELEQASGLQRRLF